MNKYVGPPYSRIKIYAARYRSMSAAHTLRRATNNNKPAAAATTAVDRRDRRTDGRTLDRFMTLTACHANRVIIRY